MSFEISPYTRMFHHFMFHVSYEACLGMSCALEVRNTGEFLMSIIMRCSTNRKPGRCFLSLRARHKKIPLLPCAENQRESKKVTGNHLGGQVTIGESKSSRRTVSVNNHSD